MSAYVVDDEPINAVLSYLSTGPHSYAAHLAERGGYSPSQTDDLERLGTDMLALNVEAVQQRYPDCRGQQPSQMPGRIGHDAFTFQFSHASRFTALKSLRCWLYQCAEGDVPETPLYKLMDGIRDLWTTEIIDSLDEYRRAPGW